VLTQPEPSQCWQLCVFPVFLARAPGSWTRSRIFTRPVEASRPLSQYM
jgi:hypothetical protein